MVVHRFSSAMADMVGYSFNQNQNEADEDQLIDVGVNLPSELMYHILCRLPVKSVGRFRCVSKDWKTLLSSPKFIKDQFLFNNHQTKIIFHELGNPYSIELRNDSNNEGHPVAICETLNFGTTNMRHYISASCNGLILLSDFINSKFSIVNPVTHEFRQLPPIPEAQGGIIILGFGYCLNDDEYTVIIALYDPSRVYMLKRNMWKRVEDSPFELRGCGAFVNGCIHWSGSWDLDSSNGICAFDFASERFREVEKPEGLKKEDLFLVDVLGGCLCLVHQNYTTTDIWVMKKYGLRDSWTKYDVYSMQNIIIYRPLFFWNCDELIVASSGGKLIVCCLKQKTSAIIPVIGEQCPGLFYGGYRTSVDSLFSPNSSDALEEPNQVQV